MSKKREMNNVASHGESELIRIMNQLRHDEICRKVAELDRCKNNAMREMRRTECSIAGLIDSGRGGKTGMHGFIGERAQVGFSNARRMMDGRPPVYKLIDDNGMTDYYRGSVPIQQKACISDGRYGLSHIQAHAQAYPEFVSKMHGRYQIPQDFYEAYERYKNMPAAEAGKLPNTQWRIWNRIQAFEEECPDIIIEPMKVDYADIQAGRIQTTIDEEKDSIEQVHRQRKEKAIFDGRPTVKEGLKVAAWSAALEGIISGVASTIEHVGDDKAITDLTRDDWMEIGHDSLTSALRGAVRGGGIYVITNVFCISAPIAGAMITVSFIVIDATAKFLLGETTEEDFKDTVIDGCTRTVVYTSCALIGARLIRSRTLGAVVGGAVGLLLCKIILRRPDISQEME